MPRQSPVPEELDQPFWDACNEDRLVVQNCKACDRLQHPPEPACWDCGSADNLEWSAVSGRGKIHSYSVMYDNSVAPLQAEQPFNTAIIELEPTQSGQFTGIDLRPVPPFLPEARPQPREAGRIDRRFCTGPGRVACSSPFSHASASEPVYLTASPAGRATSPSSPPHPFSRYSRQSSSPSSGRHSEQESS